jgi:tetratricopeptide (TPR) repeat protein
MSKQGDTLFVEYLRYIEAELLHIGIQNNEGFSNFLVGKASQDTVEEFLREYKQVTSKELNLSGHKLGSADEIRSCFTNSGNYIFNGIFTGDAKNRKIKVTDADFIAHCLGLKRYHDWSLSRRSSELNNLQVIQSNTAQSLNKAIMAEETGLKGKGGVLRKSYSREKVTNELGGQFPSQPVIYLNSRARLVEPEPTQMKLFHRQHELEKMEILMKANNTIIVAGVRGIGKSSFVHNYVSGNINAFTHIIYAVVKNGNVSEAVIEAFRESGDSIGFNPERGGDYPDTSDLLMLLVDRLKTSKIEGGLLIIDNANGLASLTHFMNLWNKHVDKEWKVIVTTFLSEINLPNTKTLLLPAMDVYFAGELYDHIVLRTQNPDLKKAALEILKTFDYNPLICELVAKLIQANERIKFPAQLTPSGIIGKKAEQPSTLNPLIDSRFASNEEFTIVQYISALFRDVLPGLTEREKAILRYLSILSAEVRDDEQLSLILPLTEDDPDLIDGLARKGWLISKGNNSTIMLELYQMAIQDLLLPDVMNCHLLLDKLEKRLRLYELGNMEKTIYDTEMESSVPLGMKIRENLIYEGVDIDCQSDDLISEIRMILQVAEQNKDTFIKKNYSVTYAQVLFNLSIALNELNDKNNALQLAVDSLQMSLSFFPVSSFRTGQILKHIAYLFRKLKKVDQALELLKISEDIYRNDPDTPEILKIRLKLSYGNIYREMNRMDLAIENLEECISDCMAKDLYDFNRASALNSLGFVYGTLGREKLTCDENKASGIEYSLKAIELRREALGLREKIHKNPVNLKAALIYNNIGAVQSRLQQFDESIISFKMCLGIREKFLPKEHASMAVIKNNLATSYAKNSYFNQCKEEDAIRDLTMALKLCEEGCQIRISLNGDESSNLAPSYYTKGLIHFQIYRYTKNKVNDLYEARRFAQKSLSLRERYNPKRRYLIMESTDLLNEINEVIKEHEAK